LKIFRAIFGWEGERRNANCKGLEMREWTEGKEEKGESKKGERMNGIGSLRDCLQGIDAP